MKEEADNMTADRTVYTYTAAAKMLQEEFSMECDIVEKMLEVARTSLRELLSTAQHALDTGDSTLLLKSAHGIKGILLNLRFNHLAESVRAIELGKTEGAGCHRLKKELELLAENLHPFFDKK